MERPGGVLEHKERQTGTEIATHSAAGWRCLKDISTACLLALIDQLSPLSLPFPSPSFLSRAIIGTVPGCAVAGSGKGGVKVCPGAGATTSAMLVWNPSRSIPRRFVVFIALAADKSRSRW